MSALSVGPVAGAASARKKCLPRFDGIRLTVECGREEDKKKDSTKSHFFSYSTSPDDCVRHLPDVADLPESDYEKWGVLGYASIVETAKFERVGNVLEKVAAVQSRRPLLD
jgi:hypothetical protein